MKKTALVLLLLAGAAEAADKHGAYSSLGYGSEPCDKVVEAFATDPALSSNLRAWANGYLTAVNAYVYLGKNIARTTKLVDREDRILAYCKKNPLRTYAAAVHALYRNLGGK